MKHDLEKLKEILEYATPTQQERIQAVIDTGTYTKAAMLLGIDESMVRQAVKRAKKKYAKQMSPMSALDPDETPVGFSIERISKHVDKEVEIFADEERREIRRNGEDKRRLVLLLNCAGERVGQRDEREDDKDKPRLTPAIEHERKGEQYITPEPEVLSRNREIQRKQRRKKHQYEVER